MQPVRQLPLVFTGLLSLHTRLSSIISSLRHTSNWPKLGWVSLTQTCGFIGAYRDFVIFWYETTHSDTSPDPPNNPPSTPPTQTELLKFFQNRKGGPSTFSPKTIRGDQALFAISKIWKNPRKKLLQTFCGIDPQYVWAGQLKKTFNNIESRCARWRRRTPKSGHRHFYAK